MSLQNTSGLPYSPCFACDAIAFQRSHDSPLPFFRCDMKRIEKNGVPLQENSSWRAEELNLEAIPLCPQDIYTYTEEADLHGALGELLQMQLDRNVAICNEGMRRSWGSNIGKLLTENNADTEKLACAFAAAGSDARMSGCAMPVVINSGSGNQGALPGAPPAAAAGAAARGSGT